MYIQVYNCHRTYTFCCNHPSSIPLSFQLGVFALAEFILIHVSLLSHFNMVHVAYGIHMGSYICLGGVICTLGVNDHAGESFMPLIAAKLF